MDIDIRKSVSGTILENDTTDILVAGPSVGLKILHLSFDR